MPDEPLCGNFRSFLSGLVADSGTWTVTHIVSALRTARAT
jgi:hypothetical protein